MSATLVHSVAVMGTVVSFEVVGHDADEAQRAARQQAVDRAVDWFTYIEAACSRFDPTSELRRLVAGVGAPTVVSELLFEAVQFALAVADATDGAFDPTVGRCMEARGFDREHRTGALVATPHSDAHASWRDVELDDAARTITLRRPLVLDLGAVAKGLAIDMAVRELVPFTDFAINAGGDLWLGGHNARGDAWTIGIRHPRDPARTVETVTVSNGAVCTSGDYERRSPSDTTQHHIVDPRAGASPAALASVTVTAPSAMVADALGTAAFVLGPEQGIALLERHGVDGVCFTPALERFATAGFRSTHASLDGAFVSHA